jgi:MtrB/PioB family decaheme-associated outer membrane protein
MQEAQEMNGKNYLRLVVATLLGAGALSGQVAFAQEMPDFEEWQCKFCPFPEKGLEGSAGASALNVSDDSARFGDYTGLDESGAYINAEADMLYRAEGGYAVSLQAQDLGLDSRFLELRAGRRGHWMVDLSWDEIPRRLDDSVSTVYDGLGSGRLTLPSSWVRGNFTSELAALDASLRDFTLGWDRQTLGLGLEFVQSKRLRYEVDFNSQTKEGSGLTWGSFLGTAADLVKPLDYQTDQVDAAIVYATDKWNVRASYYGSFFSNKNTALTWDNPFNGPDQGRMALAPDNTYQQAMLSGGYRFPTWDTSINASYAVGRMEQTDALLPYTINPGLAALPLPVAQFDGDADVTHANLRVSMRPLDKLRLTGEYRSSERDNNSGQYEWAIVQADGFQAPSAFNPVYSYETRDTLLAANYRFSRMVQVSAGWDNKIRDRDYQDVSRTDEDTTWARVRFRPVDQLSLGLRAESSSRDAREAAPVFFPGAGAQQNPLLRKYYLADRERDTLQADAGFTPAGRFSLAMRFESARDSYDQSEVGLVSADYDQYSAEASFLLGEKLGVTGYFSRENYDSRTIGAASFLAPNLAPPNWAGTSEDRHDVYGLAFNWPGLAEGKLDLRADLNRADTRGDIRIEDPLGGASDALPTLISKLTGAQLMADWHLDARWSLNAGWRWEKFDADDWAKDGVAPDTINNVLTFGADTLDYDVNVFLVGFTYRFIRPEAED